MILNSKKTRLQHLLLKENRLNFSYISDIVLSKTKIQKEGRVIKPSLTTFIKKIIQFIL